MKNQSPGNIPEVLDNGEVTRVTAGQLALALTPYAQVAGLAVNTAASGNNAAAIQSWTTGSLQSALALARQQPWPPRTGRWLREQHRRAAESVQGAVRLVQLRSVSKVVDDYKHLVQFLHFQLLGRALLLDDTPQRRLVPLVPIRLLPLCVHPQVLLNVLLDGDPAYGCRIRLIRATVLPDFDGPTKMPVHGTRGTTGSEAAYCYTLS